MVIMTHQTPSLEKYWKLLPATLTRSPLPSFSLRRERFSSTTRKAKEKETHCGCHMRRLHRLRAFPRLPRNIYLLRLPRDNVFPHLLRDNVFPVMLRDTSFGYMLSRACCGIQVFPRLPAVLSRCSLIASLFSSLPHRFNIRAADHTTSLQTLIINCIICLITSSFRFYFKPSYLVSCYQVFNCKLSITIIQSLVKNRPESEKNLINTLTFCSK